VPLFRQVRHATRYPSPHPQRDIAGRFGSGRGESITTETAHIPGAVAAGGAGLFIGLVIAAYDEIAELIAPSH
jgi:hypothetical protein